MAFVSMFFVLIIVIIAFIGFCTFVGAILLVISAFKHSSYKKKASQGIPVKRTYIVLRSIGLVCMIPLIAAVSLVVYSFIGAGISSFADKNMNLGYNVMNGNYEAAERILKRGVTPDCTRYSNRHAGNGEETLLCVLAENGFTSGTDSAGDEEEVLRMMQLLIDYGADLEYRAYEHPKDSDLHRMNDLSDYYMTSDNCGYTPLLYAVYNGEPERLRLLVDNGADINVKDYCGYNAVATIADNLSDRTGADMLEYLIDNGCTADNVTNFRQDVLFLLSRNSRQCSKMTDIINNNYR